MLVCVRARVCACARAVGNKDAWHEPDASAQPFELFCTINVSVQRTRLIDASPTPTFCLDPKSATLASLDAAIQRVLCTQLT